MLSIFIRHFERGKDCAITVIQVSLLYVKFRYIKMDSKPSEDEVVNGTDDRYDLVVVVVRGEMGCGAKVDHG